MRKKKHGGSRPGSGAKPKGKTPRVNSSFQLDPKHKKWIEQQSHQLGISQSDFLNQLLDEYLELTVGVRI